MLAYTGKVLNYILATPEQPDDADNPLRLAFGNEASTRDITEFARRFGCNVRDSYGSTEGIIIIRRDASMPQGALGKGEPTLKVVDPDTGEERPAVRFGSDGRPTNLEEAVGEIVETAPTSSFEGYYRNEEATTARFRDGWYWSGDLAFRDDDDWLYFAGRSNEWLRVDGENFAAAPVEAIIARHPDVRSLAVYAVPDDPVGDRVMVALELANGAAFDPAAFDAFLAEQPDLGPKWVPAFVSVTDDLPKLASLKIDKQRLRREAWRTEPVFWRPAKGELLRPLDDADRSRLDPLLPRAVRVVVFGATGVIGRAALDHFSQLPDGDVIGVSRRAVDVEGVTHVPLDLVDRRACERASRALAGVTHVVYAALQESDDLTAGWRDRALMERNLAMFSNALEPLLDAAGDTLEHVSLLQGAKAYGLHVGRSTVPAKERARATSTTTSTSCRRTGCARSLPTRGGRGRSCAPRSCTGGRSAAR